jgi:hypothetical protein|tara:strand:- start:1207 stop:1350 length:144 start_codon:yes stop_codon:yes gene_type:complete
MAQMSTPVKNERPKTAVALPIRTGTGLQQRKDAEKVQSPKHLSKNNK